MKFCVGQNYVLHLMSLKLKRLLMEMRTLTTSNRVIWKAKVLFSLICLFSSFHYGRTRLLLTFLFLLTIIGNFLQIVLGFKNNFAAVRVLTKTIFNTFCPKWKGGQTKSLDKRRQFSIPSAQNGRGPDKRRDSDS